MFTVDVKQQQQYISPKFKLSSFKFLTCFGHKTCTLEKSCDLYCTCTVTLTFEKSCKYCTLFLLWTTNEGISIKHLAQRFWILQQGRQSDISNWAMHLPSYNEYYWHGQNTFLMFLIIWHRYYETHTKLLMVRRRNKELLLMELFFK